MLLKMFTDDAPDDTEIIEPLRALAGEESS
jgi:hypothetical protein